LGDQIRRISWVGHAARKGRGGILWVLVWETELSRLLGRIWGKLETNVKIDVKGMGWDGLVRINLPRDDEHVAVCCVRGDESWVP